MKYLLLLPIKIYWFLIPPHKRNSCIFKESCSKNVYRITKNKGIKAGFQALSFRYKNCRSKYLITHTKEQTLLVTATRFVLQEHEISEGLIEKKHLR